MQEKRPALPNLSKLIRPLRPADRKEGIKSIFQLKGLFEGSEEEVFDGLLCGFP